MLYQVSLYKRFKSIVVNICILLTALVITACGGEGGGSSPQKKQVVSIQVTPKTALSKGVSQDQLPVGLSVQYEATLSYRDGSSQVATEADGVQWRVSNDNAIISTTGKVTVLSQGEVVIEASLAGIKGERELTISGAILTDLTLTYANTKLIKGLTQPYQAQGHYSDGTSLDVTHYATWRSSDSAVATIDAAGMAQALELGRTYITAIFGGRSVSTTLEIIDATLTAITLSPDTLQLAKGQTQAMIASGSFDDGKSANITNSVTWLSGNPAIVSIDNAGVLKALSVGTTEITATFGDHSTSATVEVTNAILTSIELTPANAIVRKGLTQAYTAQGIFTDESIVDITGQAIWSSSDPAIASIDQAGLATAVKIGTTNISVTLNGISAEVPMEVTRAPLVTILLSPSSARVAKGDTLAFSAQGFFADGSNDDITTSVAWSSSLPSIASINTAGIVNAVEVGKTSIIATLDGQSVEAILNVFPIYKKVVTWGSTTSGGDSSAVQPLTDVIAIARTTNAFAALKSDGTVVTWGNPIQGGDSSGIQAQLTNVQKLFSSDESSNSTISVAFAALKTDGTVVVWGRATNGGDSSAVQSQLINVKDVKFTNSAGAALKADGTVVTWGTSTTGGDSSAVQSQLTNVEKIFNNAGVFVALKKDGSVVSWGIAGNGGNSSTVQSLLTNVQMIANTATSFAALKSDGTVVTWGNTNTGGNSSSVQAKLTGVKQIVGNNAAFAAVKLDGTVVTWGSELSGANSSSVQASLTNVKSVVATRAGFAALKNDGTVVSWGYVNLGGAILDSSAVQSQLIDVQQIFTTIGAFAALKSDGTVVTWGDGVNGGNSSGVSSQLVNVSSIVSDGIIGTAFAALKTDGSVVTWGPSSAGGDSSGVQFELTNVQFILGNSQAFAAVSAQ